MDPASAVSPVEASTILSSSHTASASDSAQVGAAQPLQTLSPQQQPLQKPEQSGRLQKIKDIRPLPPFQPDLYQRGWSSIPHPTLPLLATAHNKSVTIFSLATFTAHSSLTGGHSRSVRSATWKPSLPPHKLCLVTGSFDSTAGLWRYEQKNDGLERDVTARGGGNGGNSEDGSDKEEDDDAWEFTLVLEGQEHEIKSVAFSPSGQFLATCSRDKSVWIWEDVGTDEDDDEWETVAVLNEHEGDVKCVAWCPDVPGRRSTSNRNHYSLEVLASTSYDNTIRIWREDGDGEWICVSVLEGHDGTVWGVQWEADPARKRFPRLLTWSADQTLRIWTLDEEEEEEEGDAETGTGSVGNASGPLFRSNLGGVPNTMRRSLHESWTCTAVLPRAHTRDIYSATWSASTGLVASTGSDGTVIVYAEFDGSEPSEEMAEDEAAAMLDGDVLMTNGQNGATAMAASNGHSRTPGRVNIHSHSHGNSHNHDHGHGHDHDHDHGRGDSHEDAHDHASHSHSHSHAARQTAAPVKHWRIVGNIANAHGPYEINNVTWCRRFDPGTERRGIEEMLVTTGDDGVVRPWQIVT